MIPVAEVLDLQESPTPETPGDQKASHVSYALCNNSYTSQMLCYRA